MINKWYFATYESASGKSGHRLLKVPFFRSVKYAYNALANDLDKDLLLSGDWTLTDFYRIN